MYFVNSELLLALGRAEKGFLKRGVSERSLFYKGFRENREAAFAPTSGGMFVAMIYFSRRILQDRKITLYYLSRSGIRNIIAERSHKRRHGVRGLTRFAIRLCNAKSGAFEIFDPPESLLFILLFFTFDLDQNYHNNARSIRFLRGHSSGTRIDSTSCFPI